MEDYYPKKKKNYQKIIINSKFEFIYKIKINMEYKNKKVIIFACVHNAGRSQIAFAFFNKYKTNENIIGISAGTNPANEIHPNVLTIMKEIDIDLTNIKPRKLDDKLAKTANTIVTMGCGEKCPYIPGIKIIDWQIPDPKNESFEKVREIRDYIEIKIKEFIKDNKY